MTESVKLTIPSNSKYLCLVRKFLHHLLLDHQVSEETAQRLILCVDEACSNIIKYSYEGCPDQPIEICFSLAGDSFQVKIRDYGKQCDSQKIKPRPLDQIEPGGLGTFFMKEIMDEVSYCTNRETGTLLTMCKQLKNELTSSRQ
jgi:anti-sigma regulatory factor (Ser/Thr protein kinase)